MKRYLTIIFLMMISTLSGAQEVSTQGVLAVYERAKAMASVSRNPTSNTTENYILAAEFRGMMLGVYYAHTNAAQSTGNKAAVCLGEATSTEVARRLAIFIVEEGGDRLLSLGPSMMIWAPLRFLYPCKD